MHICSIFHIAICAGNATNSRLFCLNCVPGMESDMGNRENSTYKYIILAVVFMITVAVTFISMNYETVSVSMTTMDQATLPVVMMQTEQGMLFNRLYGYTGEIDSSLMGESLTPLPTDKKLAVVIDTYNQNIKGLSYKIRDLSDMSLIENTQVSDFTQEEERIHAVLNIKNLIDNNKEYLLEIILSTEKEEKISYYTKIISGTDFRVQDKLNFVLEFNGYTYDQSTLKNISQYIESSTSGDNSNYGKVNIHSKQAQIGWGDLNPFIESDMIPTVKEIGEEVAVIVLDYMIGAENKYNSYDTYSVKEYFRIRQSGSKMYLLDYEREAGQLFNSRNDLTSATRINLGIQADTEVTAKASDNGVHTFFVNQGTLWDFNSEDSTFTKVFSFEAEDSDNIRERNNDHEIRIMNVEDEGNGYFLVCGYMSRGEHEGEIGVSLCSYNYEENIVTEELYIPVNISYEKIEEKIGGIAYVNENHLFYILIDDTLYAINLMSHEVMTEVTGLTERSYAVSKDKNVIAYSINGERYDTDTIRIFDMEKGSDYEIHAAEGEKLKVLGYINSDFIYGMAREEDIGVEEDGTVLFPMYQINIMDKDYNVIKEYQESGVYVKDAVIDNLRVNLYRVTQRADGGYEDTTMDQLINREENSSSEGLVIDTIYTDDRQTEVVMMLKQAASNIENVSMRLSEEVIFKKDESLDLLTR